MASLILAAGFMTYSKVKDKREAKKEKKRKAYETRYEELQKEHSHHQEKHIQTQQTGDRHNQAELDPFADVASKGRRSSTDSQRSQRSDRDDPTRWVNEVVLARSKSQGVGGT